VLFIKNLRVLIIVIFFLILANLHTYSQSVNVTDTARINLLSNTSFWESQGFIVYNISNIYNTNSTATFKSTPIFETTKIFSFNPINANDIFGGTVGTYYSSGWSGYVIPTNRLVGDVFGSWKVQNVSIFVTGSSSQWIGVGGISSLGDNTLIQVGTESDAPNDNTNYYAWIELVPHSEQELPNSIAPGDIINAVVMFDGNYVNGTQKWFVFINDTSKRWTDFGYFPYNSLQISADFITEDPCSSAYCTPANELPYAKFGYSDFGNDFAQSSAKLNGTIFSASSATINGINKNLGSFNNDMMCVSPSGNSCNYTVNRITPDNTSFSVTDSNVLVTLNFTSKTINKNAKVSMVSNVFRISPSNAIYQWFTANSVFGLNAIKIGGSGVFGHNVTTSNFLTTVNSPTIFVVFATDSGISPNPPIAYNYTIIKIIPNLTIVNSLTLGQSNTIIATCGNGDTCEILINNAIQTTQITTANFLWTPSTTGNYLVSAFDATEGLYTNQTVDVTNSISNSPILSVANTLYLGQSNTIQATCSMGDTCEILINNAIQTTHTTTANYVWKPAAPGNYLIGAFDSNSILYTNQTVNVIAPKVPQNVTSYVPITFYNNQSIGTGSNFQQIFYLNPSIYSNYLDPNLNNVVFFYGNGSIVNSWLEGGSWLNGQVNKTSREADYWLKINPGIPSNSNYTIYMGFAPFSTSEFNTTTTGEAPQIGCPNGNTINCTYARYDDGANVFSFYEDFNGNVLDSKWSGTNYIIDNGITSNGYVGYLHSYLQSTSSYSTLNVATDFYFGGGLGIFGVFGNGVGQLNRNNEYDSYGTTSIYFNSSNSLGTTDVSMSIGPTVFSVTANSTSDHTFDYVNGLYSLTSGRDLSTIHTFLFNSTGNIGFVNINSPLYVIRQRVNPPYGNMPGESIGNMVNVPYTNNLISTSYSPKTLLNPYNAPTPRNYQYVITINGLSYGSSPSPSFDNAWFTYTNGTIIPSWFEGNTINPGNPYYLNASANLTFVLKLSNSIAAKGNVIVDLNFGAKNTIAFNNNTIGESPLLTGTYGWFDNGRNIFNYYNNFANYNGLEFQNESNSWNSRYGFYYTLTKFGRGLGLDASHGAVDWLVINSIFNQSQAIDEYINSTSTSASAAVDISSFAMSNSSQMINIVGLGIGYYNGIQEQSNLSTFGNIIYSNLSAPTYYPINSMFVYATTNSPPKNSYVITYYQQNVYSDYTGNILSNSKNYIPFINGYPAIVVADEYNGPLNSPAEGMQYFVNWIDTRDTPPISNTQINSITLTISNPSGTASPTNSLQQIVINSSRYKNSEASNLQNIQFAYSNGTIIPSWLESGPSFNDISTYWLKIGKSIPASPPTNTLLIKMNFYNYSLVKFNGNNTGLAPQLIKTDTRSWAQQYYGQYDDGNNIFPKYYDFLTLNNWYNNNGQCGYGSGCTETGSVYTTQSGVEFWGQDAIGAYADSYLITNIIYQPSNIFEIFVNQTNIGYNQSTYQNLIEANNTPSTKSIAGNAFGLYEPTTNVLLNFPVYSVIFNSVENPINYTKPNITAPMVISLQSNSIYKNYTKLTANSLYLSTTNITFEDGVAPTNSRALVSTVVSWIRVRKLSPYPVIKVT